MWCVIILDNPHIDHNASTLQSVQLHEWYAHNLRIQTQRFAQHFTQELDKGM
jgi:hypothetical protein